jgi:hypothetical protein
MLAFRCGAILLIASASFAQSPQPNPASLTAEAIMARVAANQDRSEALRKQYVYKQQIHILTHKPGGKLMREETADYHRSDSAHEVRTRLGKVDCFERKLRTRDSIGASPS